MISPLNFIPQQEFEKCFQQRQLRWAKCIAAQEDYWKINPLSNL